VLSVKKTRNKATVKMLLFKLKRLKLNHLPLLRVNLCAKYDNSNKILIREKQMAMVHILSKKVSNVVRLLLQYPG